MTWSMARLDFYRKGSDLLISKKMAVHRVVPNAIYLVTMVTPTHNLVDAFHTVKMCLIIIITFITNN